MLAGLEAIPKWHVYKTIFKQRAMFNIILTSKIRLENLQTGHDLSNMLSYFNIHGHFHGSHLNHCVSIPELCCWITRNSLTERRYNTMFLTTWIKLSRLVFNFHYGTIIFSQFPLLLFPSFYSLPFRWNFSCFLFVLTFFIVYFKYLFASKNKSMCFLSFLFGFGCAQPTAAELRLESFKFNSSNL
jgi:hypothetical protein